jgi:hypothetical protein
MPDQDRKGDRGRKSSRPEFEIAYYTKELGRPLQRKLLQRQFDAGFTDNQITSAHGEDPAPDGGAQPPSDERAG